MFRKIFILIVFCFIQIVRGYSQTPSYFHYTATDGLASSTVYDLIQDHDGYIWLATINGLSRFDGKNFITFRTQEGLNSNSITSLLEGENGELYIGNYEKGINVIRDGRIENYCCEINGMNFATSFLYGTSSGVDRQKIYAYRRWGNINVISQEGSSKLMTNVVSTRPICVNKLELIPNGDLIALTRHGLFRFIDDKLIKIKIDRLPETDVYCLANDHEGSYFIGMKGMIYKITNNVITRRYTINLAGNNVVMALLTDKNKNIWFSIMNRGFFVIPFGSDKIIDIGSSMGLKNTLVNNYLEDNEGNIWISTFGKGVYCLNNLYLKNYTEKDGLSNTSVYSIVKENSGKLLIGTFSGVNLLENDKFDQIEGNSFQTLTEYIYRIKNIKNEFYVCGAFGRNDIRNISFKGVNLHLMDRPSFCKTSGGLYLFGSGANSIFVQKSLNYKAFQPSIFNIFGDSPNINRINEIFEDSLKNIWVGTALGLCKISNISDKMSVWKKTFFLSNPVFNAKINSIIQDIKTNVWFAGDKGVAQICLKNDSITTYTKLRGYDLTSSTSLAVDDKNRIWIGNMKGLFLLDGNSVKLLDRQTGLPSDEVYSLFYDNEKKCLYIGGSNGLSLLDINLYDSYIQHAPKVKINSIKAGDSVYTNYQKLVFKPEQNNVYLNFKALCFASPGSVRYKYEVNGVWMETDHDFLDFISLRKGKYKLQIMAKSQNSNWGKPCNLSFVVKPRYYETVWFKLGRALLIILISISFISWRWKLRNRKARAELELTERINDLKHQALSAMMNPHFIFNSLNSVQYLINSQQNELANDYIAMMSKLIRKNLDTAGDGFILLSEEISRLKLYLDLEKLRFQESFSYKLIIGENVDSECIMIPNMIVQPFVENTLWHGIINSGSKGLVIISFLFEEVVVDSICHTSLIIKVTDNGIGIIEARKHRREDHISKGIQIIEERLRLLSTKMELPKPIMLEDLSNGNSYSHGTEVIISLPVPLYRIIDQR